MRSLPVFLTAVLALGAASLLDLSARPAYAGLGATAASVEPDRASMKGQLRSRSGAGLLGRGNHGARAEPWFGSTYRPRGWYSR